MKRLENLFKDRLYNQFTDKNDILNKRHYILLSGGFDSTLLALQLLDLYKKRKILKKIVLVYCDVPFLKDVKIEKERESIESLKNYLDEYNYHYEFIKININMEGFYTQNSYPSGNFQQYLFLSQLSVMVDKDSIIHIGYIAEDNNTYINKIQYLVNDINDFSDCNISISFPLLSFKKEYILLKLSKYDDLIQNIWTCENPIKKDKIIKRCNCCDKCKELNKALLSIKSDKESIKETLDSFFEDPKSILGNVKENK